jgi:hypothetical protein
MVLEYMRLILAICLTLAALSVALNRHHAMLGAMSRLTDRAAGARRPRGKLRLPRRTAQIDFDEDAGKGEWVTGRGEKIDRGDDDDLDWLIVGDDD